MSLKSFSIFYYGLDIDESNQYLNFSEGSTELSASVPIGSYTHEQLVEAIEIELNSVGSLTYIVNLNRDLRTVTIQASDDFELLVFSGSQKDSSIFSTIGFVGSDKIGSDLYIGTGSIGKVFEPQFILQDHIPSSRYKNTIEASVNKAASGNIEIVSFGIEKFIQMNFKFITNLTMDGSVIKNNPSGLEDFTDFMDHLIMKKPVEYMENILDKNTFESIILESNTGSQNGTGYQLTELYSQNLPNIFESGIMKFRVIR